jgi:multidrug resistance efflux pump
LNQKQKAQTDIEENIEKIKRSLQDGLDQLNLGLTTKQAQAAQLKSDLNIMKNKDVKPYFNGNQIVSCVKNGIVQNISINMAAKLGIQYAPTKVLQLIDADSLTVSAEVEEEFIENVSLGQNVDIVPASNKSVSVPGVVTRIPSVAVEKDGKRIIKVVVKPKTANQFLKPGYTADVYFPVKK